MASQSGPVPTIISVLRKATATMVDDLLARLTAAGFDGLTRAHQAVFENLDRDGTRISELAARAGMTQQSMSELVAAIERRGYLERRIDPSDRRARLVTLTPTGRQMARLAIREATTIYQQWSQQLAAAGVTGDLLEAISTALDRERQPLVTVAVDLPV